ncbi:hypothetical protein KIN20_021487 [Parelaphostrongylus tenuis]|uniref:Uncharacterized protein n=1 Tax=Parelaphostrongylus tenuis TaxID=148309 RepID=A0AAD5MP05_PARTN|nr:hypothetical protein KIN20_021487 [Parelaphostrongylus tenuis]
MAGGHLLGFGADVGNIATSAIQSVVGIAPKNRNMISWEKPLLKTIEQTAAEHASSLDDSEREQWIMKMMDWSLNWDEKRTCVDENFYQVFVLRMALIFSRSTSEGTAMLNKLNEANKDWAR